MPSHDDLLTIFTATIDEQNGSPVLQVPDRELDLGDLALGGSYRVAVLPQHTSQQQASSQPASRGQQRSAADSGPPVSEGEEIDVEIEDVGEQGDGVARVGQGYVLFVPDADLGDRVTVEVGKTLENYGFAEVVSPEPVTG